LQRIVFKGGIHATFQPTIMSSLHPDL